MAFSNRQVQEWRREYLQEMKNALENATSIALFEEIAEEDTDVSEDDRLFYEFMFKKQVPLIECILFQEQNNPFQEDVFGEANSHHFPRYEMSDVYDFIAGMTNYGKYLVVNQFPGDDKAFIALRDAVFANDKEAFLSIIEKHNVDFTAFRQSISASMFRVSGYGEMLKSFYDGIPNLTETESADSYLAGLDDFNEHMKGHLSKRGYDAVSSINYTSSVLSGIGKEAMVIDEEIASIITRFRFSDSELLGQFLSSSYSFGIYSIILETTFINPELDIVNKFLDDPKTTPMLNDIERFVYLISEGGLLSKKIFIPQPLRGEIESGGIKKSLQDFNSLLAENEKPEEQERPTSRSGNLITEREPKKVKDDYVPHWPTDDELIGYLDNFSGSEFFPNTLFGSAGNVKASDVKRLLDVLIDLKIIQDELQTKLIFLARYSGKRIPHLELKPIEWRMLDDTNRERALGYLIMKTAGAQYAKGAAFFYYEINGERVQPDSRVMGPGAHALNNLDRRYTTKTEFEHKINAFLNEYLSSKKG